MRHHNSKRQLSMTAEKRQKLMRNLTISLLRKEKIITTAGRAKTVRPYVERVISLAKRYDNQRAKQMLHPYLLNKEIIQKCVSVLKARYVDRTGGYVRLTKLSPRAGDNAPRMSIELV